ncbi:MAG TPA: hypothetical protein PK264_03595, partial [Hyphomicrobiaceae bacterium]|nr:hypothetical protein [Hyphomicrobiaceae bacterium]
MAGTNLDGGGTHQPGRRLGLLRLLILPLVISLAVIAAQALRKPIKAPFADEFYYLTIARDLSLHGVITDGPFKARLPDLLLPAYVTADERPEASRPGRVFGPAYPILVSS